MSDAHPDGTPLSDRSARTKALWQRPEFREKQRNALRRRYQEASFGECMARYTSKRLKALWQDQEFREKQIERLRSAWKKPERAAEISKLRRERRWKKDHAPIEIPNWVPAEFRETYERIARTSGEEDAASAAREYKRALRGQAK
jgi:hypothetical protein